MKRTKNLNLPIYDQPEFDTFRITDYNAANKELDKLASEVKLIMEENIVEDIKYARGGHNTLDDRLDYMDKRAAGLRADVDDLKENGGGGESKPGEDGFSPTIDVEERLGTHTLYITDKNGQKVVVVKDGTDGQMGMPGFSPTVEIREGKKMNTIVFTDHDESGSPTGHYFNVHDGKSVIIAESTYNRNFTIEKWTEYTSKPQEKFFEITNSDKYVVGDNAIIKGTISDGRNCLVVGEVVTIGSDSSLTLKNMIFIKDGVDGKNGSGSGGAGQDGFSPKVSIKEGSGTHTLSITDKEGVKSTVIKDGVSPTVEIRPGDKVNTVVITDAKGSHYFNVHDGKDGKDGTGGAAAGVSSINKLTGAVTIVGDEKIEVAQGSDGQILLIGDKLISYNETLVSHRKTDPVQLTTDRYQSIESYSTQTVKLPTEWDLMAIKITEIHLYVNVVKQTTLTFDGTIKWQSQPPKIEPGFMYEFIFTYCQDTWLGGVVKYE